MWKLAESMWGREQVRSLPFRLGKLVVNWLVKMPVAFWDLQPHATDLGILVKQRVRMVECVGYLL